MAPADQQSAPPAPAPQPTACANCGAALAPDQRYCLSCGARRGEPRVPISPPPAEAPSQAPPPQQGRPADVSPLAAVIGIALLGGMLLIGVLIGRGDSNDNTTPTAVVQVGEGGSTTTATSESGTDSQTTPGAVSSEWPAGTDGFTVQLSSLTKSSATPETVDAAKQSALDDGAPAAAVLDSDLYSSLPTGNYVIYSGVYDNRKEAEAGLQEVGDSFPDAQVIEVTGKGGGSGTDGVPQTDESIAPDLGSVGGDVTTPGELGLPPTSDTGGVTESEK
jgi:hypothetical protein